LKNLITIVFLFSFAASFAQKSNNLVQKGNELYKKGEYKNALTEYEKALQADQKNNAAQFNAGNALQKEQNFPDAAKSFQSVLESGNDPSLQAKAGYNKGVAEVKQKQLQEAVNSFKQSLRLDATDNETRENLQKALNELKKQNDKKDDPKKDDQKKQDQKPPEPKPKNEMNKQQAENLLNQLRQEEKHLQELQKQKIKQTKPDKDW